MDDDVDNDVENDVEPKQAKKQTPKSKAHRIILRYPNFLRTDEALFSH